MSAVFSRVNNKSIVLGTTEQLIGTEWLNAPPFRYAGNFGPVEMSATLKRDLQLIGDVGGEHCGLVGLFGVDFILRDERPWVVEVNPRYTASVEVLELATGIRSLAIDDDATSLATGVVGKAIWYAPHRLVMPNYEMAAGALGVRIQFEGSTHEIECADVPSPGEVIEPTWPVLTIFATARTRDACLKQLRRGADCVRQALCG
jgi:predicted ATP-grasp superfamily ATP-dependent carboligase